MMRQSSIQWYQNAAIQFPDMLIHDILVSPSFAMSHSYRLTILAYRDHHGHHCQTPVSVA
jgi:hypothetical protein